MIEELTLIILCELLSDALTLHSVWHAIYCKWGTGQIY